MREKVLLIADDDIDDTELFKEALCEVDSTAICYSAINGERVFDVLNHELRKPHVIFLDLNMPIMNGWSCLKKLRESELTSKIPVVIYTTSATEKDREFAKKLGALEIISKPTKFTDIIATIESILSRIDATENV